MKNILAVDIGNSSIGLGLFEGDGLKAKDRIRTVIDRDEGWYGERIRSFFSTFRVDNLDGIIMSSVVPEVTATLSSAFSMETGLKPLRLFLDIDPGISFDVTNPDEVGQDRIANVIGAMGLYGGPGVVVDFGTATTISAFREDTFVGGAILPGLETMAKALNTYTSRLPLVNFDDIKTDGMARALGKDTRQNILSGMIYGTSGAVERIIERIEIEEGCGLRIVLTGGFSVIMSQFLKRDFYLEPDLTLKGLRFLYERGKDA